MPIDYEVQQGDCITSIASANGFKWETIWNDGGNAALRAKRKDPNVLFPGDVVHIPDLNVFDVPRPTDQKHKFTLEDSRAKLHIRLLEEDLPAAPASSGSVPKPITKPRANVPYVLEIEGQPNKKGTTNGKGEIEIKIPPGATSGTLHVGSGTTQDVYQLQLGVLDPIDTPAGVEGRLRNMGYGADDMAEAIRAFQDKAGLPVTGEADDATRGRLVSEFGQ